MEALRWCKHVQDADGKSGNGYDDLFDDGQFGCLGLD